MDTHGHHELSHIGEDVLAPALARGNREKQLRIGAFYLGNWLTDVSQCVDPIAYAGAAESIGPMQKSIEAFFARLRFDAPSWLPSFVPDPTAPLRELRDRLVQAERSLAADLETALLAGRDGAIAKGLKELFRYVGYFKFVVDEQGHPTGMDPELYLRLFDDRFTQYVAHEHLDRPAIGTLPTGGNRYDMRKSSKPLNTRTKTSGSGDLYTYLRTDIELAAGLLAYLDSGSTQAKSHQSWASASFHTTRTKFIGRDGAPHPVDDADYEWNYHLAMLGHALHAIEDFFAHSTFVEHTAQSLPREYDLLQRYEEADVLARRLKEWNPSLDEETDLFSFERSKRHALDDSWTKLPSDTHVVTGYFDKFDTIVSLTHVLREALHRPNATVGKKLDDIRQYDYQKLLADTLELVSDFSRVWKEPHGNLAVELLRKAGGDGLEQLEGKSKLDKIVGLLEEGPLSSLPGPIKDSFGSAVKILGAIKLGKTIFGALKSVSQFLSGPLGWLAKFLPKAVFDLLVEFGEVYLTKLVERIIGSRRIGCHSLIAKDNGPELFHRASTACAGAVHWYIVHTLTRHARRPVLDAARCGPGGTNRNALYVAEHIDWLELCEYFLAHPLARVTSTKVTRETSVPILHVTRRDPASRMSPDSLARLAEEYAPTFMAVPGGPQRLTWEVIADANFPTAGMTTEQRKRAVNRVLRDHAHGLLVKDGINYAFVPGLPIVIPYQRRAIDLFEAEDTDRLWWYPVIVGKRGAQELAQWFDAQGCLSGAAPPWAHRPFPVPKPENDAYHDRMVAQQNDLRRLGDAPLLPELF